MTKKSNAKAYLSGGAIGAANGIFGGGGGMIAVPLFIDALGYPEKQAHATTILVIAPVCAVSALAYVIAGFARLPVIIPAAIGNVLGGMLGAEFLEKLPKLWVNAVFVAVMLAAGVRLVIG